jgi:carboxylesterase
LLVHGLSSTPQSVALLGAALAGRGVEVETILLPGHGTTPEDLEHTPRAAWYAAVRDGLARLRPRCQRLFVCGQSLGGTLALRAAALEPVDGVISLAGFLYLHDWRVKLLPVLQHVRRWERAIGNDIADPAAAAEVCYDRVPLRTISELVALGTEVQHLLPRIAVPALVVQSRIDHTVPPDTADCIYARLGSRDKELLRLEHSFHVVAMDRERDLVAAHCLRFMRRVARATDHGAACA